MKTKNASNYKEINSADANNIIEALSFAIHIAKQDNDHERVETYRKIIKDINNRHEY